jgi:hypothetical protein
MDYPKSFIDESIFWKGDDLDSDSPFLNLLDLNSISESCDIMKNIKEYYDKKNKNDIENNSTRDNSKNKENEEKNENNSLRIEITAPENNEKLSSNNYIQENEEEKIKDDCLLNDESSAYKSFFYKKHVDYNLDLPLSLDLKDSNESYLNYFIEENENEKEKTNDNLLLKNKNKKKLGRKRKNEIDYEEEPSKNTHTKFSLNNQIRKIKIHILKFGIDLINDCIKDELNYQYHKIRKISKQITSNISINENKKWFKLKMEDILKVDINGKYKNGNKDMNTKVINILRKKKIDKTNEILDMNFEDLHNLFIKEKENLINEYKYPLKKAKNLNDFLNDLKKKGENDNYIDSIKNNTINFFQFFKEKNARKKKNN